MSEPRPDDHQDPDLDAFIRETSPDVDAEEIANIDDARERTSVMEDLQRRRRRYGWAVLAPLLLIGGFFALRFALALIASAESGNRAGFLDLGIAMFALMVAFLVYTKHKETHSER